MTRGTTVKATKDVRPKHPKVDRGEAFEQLVRQLYKPAVERWCKTNASEMPDKEVRGNVVDNLTAQFTSTLETLIDATTDSYLSTAAMDDDEVDCPKCNASFELPESYEGEEDEEVKCPECKHSFVPDEDDDDDDVLEAEIVGG